MNFLPLMMNTMMKTALEETVTQSMDSKALLKKAKKQDTSSWQCCSNVGGHQPYIQTRPGMTGATCSPLQPTMLPSLAHGATREW